MAYTRAQFLLGLLWLAPISGCGDGEHEVPAPPSVIIGTGEAEFEAMEGEPTIELAAGFQGGFHVWVSFLAYGFDQARIDVELFTEVDGDTGSRLKLGGPLKFVPAIDNQGQSVYTLAGYPGQIKNARCANGKRVHLEATVSDASGRSAHDERYCIVTLDEKYRSQNCQ